MSTQESMLGSSGDHLSREDAVGLLNEAKLSDRDDKQHLLAQVFEFAFNKERHLLSEFLPHLLEFELDQSAVIRKKDIVQCAESLTRFVDDESPNVSKRAMLCVTNIWRNCLEYMVSGGGQSPAQSRGWGLLMDLKSHIIKMLDHSNDSIKPHALKFTEAVVLTFSSVSSTSSRNKTDTFSLETVPTGHAFLQTDALKRDGEACLQLIIELLSKPGLTSTTIAAIATSLGVIARQRTHLIAIITPALIQAQQQPLPSLSALTPSNQQNANHAIRMALVAIARLRSPVLVPWVVALRDSLVALGTPKDQIEEAIKSYGDLKELPQLSNRNKRPPDSPPQDTREKKQRTEDRPSEAAPATTPPQPKSQPDSPPPNKPLPQAEQLAILNLLNILPTQLVVDLIFENMSLPIPNMPVSADSDIIKSLGGPVPAPTPPPVQSPPQPVQTPAPPGPRGDPRLGRVQDPRGSRTTPPTQSPPPAAAAPNSPPVPSVPVSPPATTPTPIPMPVPTGSRSPIDSPPISQPPVPGFSQSIPTTVPAQTPPPQSQPPQAKPVLPKAPVLPLPSFTEAQLRLLADGVFGRIMGAESGATHGGKRSLWVALVGRHASYLPIDGEMAQRLITYILADFPARREVAHTWITHEFLASPDDRYPQLLLAMLRTLQANDPTNRAFNSLIVEVPDLPEEVWDMMREYSTAVDRVTLGLSTLRDLVVWRPPVRDRGLALLLDYAYHEDEAIRSPAIRLVANQLYPLPALTQPILDFASELLRSLTAINPNPELQQDAEMKEAPEEEPKIKTEPVEPESESLEKRENGDTDEVKQEEKQEDKPETSSGLSELQIQRKLFLYFALCTKKHELLAGLLDVYMATSPDVRKVIHQQMAVLIKTIGMGSPHVLQLISQCPKGGEGFAMQFLRTLTEATRPSSALVNAAKTAYKRLGDARLIIPVLPGMEKDEVIAFLPKIIALPPAVVKSVVTSLAAGPAPLTCAELLVALHLVDGVPLRRVLEATQYCLDMPTVFKQDVMAVVLSQLSSSPNIPALFMRTMLQTIGKFQKLTGYITEILSSLVPKQVWADKRLWEGFIRCCYTARPHSYKVVLKLPAPQLEEVLKTHPDMKEGLVKVAKQDKKSIPKAILKVLGFDEPAAPEEKEP